MSVFRIFTLALLGASITAGERWVSVAAAVAAILYILLSTLLSTFPG